MNLIYRTQLVSSLQKSSPNAYVVMCLESKFVRLVTTDVVDERESSMVQELKPFKSRIFPIMQRKPYDRDYKEDAIQSTKFHHNP